MEFFPHPCFFLESMQKTNILEKQLVSGLVSCGVDLQALSSSKKALGAAVSGGADSVCLLLGLCSICKEYSIPLKVITVNHFIRSDAESSGDAEYVHSLCKTLKDQGYDVECSIYNLKKGQVNELAGASSCGIEAAARELRYQAFEGFIKEKQLDYLCLAHNKNDQLETLLMRFLQGSSSACGGGIPCVRGPFIRPLLWTSRQCIEEYLNYKKVSWRTDSTNSDTAYLRNRIRGRLIPLLNKEFVGWDNALLQGMEKEALDAACLNKQAEEFFRRHAPFDKLRDHKAPEVITFPGGDFYKLDRAIQLRVLTLAMNALGLNKRIPYVFLRDVCDYADNYYRRENSNFVESRKTFADVCIVFSKKELLIKKSFERQNEIVFSVIIKESGKYELPFGQIEVPDIFDFPLMLRSCRPDDVVACADGSTKKVNSVLSDWHVPESQRNCIPLVQALNEPEQSIIGILGSCLGYSDWIVKLDKKNESK